MVTEQVLCNGLHGRERGARELVRIDDDINAVCREFGFGDCIEGSRDNNNWRRGVRGSELIAELQNLGGILFAGMDHDSVCAGLYELIDATGEEGRVVGYTLAIALASMSMPASKK